MFDQLHNYLTNHFVEKKYPVYRKCPLLFDYSKVCLNTRFWLAGRCWLNSLNCTGQFNHRSILMCCFNICTLTNKHHSRTHTHTRAHTHSRAHTLARTHTQGESVSWKIADCAAHRAALRPHWAPGLWLMQGPHHNNYIYIQVLVI